MATIAGGYSSSIRMIWLRLHLPMLLQGAIGAAMPLAHASWAIALASAAQLPYHFWVSKGFRTLVVSLILLVRFILGFKQSRVE